VGAVSIAVYLAYEDLTGSPASLRGALMLTGFVVLVAAALGWLALAVARQQSWARSPSIVVQLLLLPMAYYLISNGLAWIGIPVGLVAVAVIVLLVNAASREAMGIR
jgi:hypothetical protein